MFKKNTITVYWAPAMFSLDEASWNMLYPDPKLLLPNLYETKTENAIMPRCPAVKEKLKNIASFHSSIDDVFDLPNEQMREIAFTDSSGDRLLVPAKVSLHKVRESSMEGFINVEYNLGWVFFSEEPLEAKFTAPYFPATTPVEGAYLSSGQYDIGRWFRPYMLDYHIPLGAKRFSVKEGDPLLFVDFLTDKKVILKRFQITKRLKALFQEASTSSRRYGTKMTLEKRYKMASDSRIPQIVLEEIKKNLIQ
jgi:hypothetical protein